MSMLSKKTLGFLTLTLLSIGQSAFSKPQQNKQNCLELTKAYNSLNKDDLISSVKPVSRHRFYRLVRITAMDGPFSQSYCIWSRNKCYELVSILSSLEQKTEAKLAKIITVESINNPKTLSENIKQISIDHKNNFERFSKKYPNFKFLLGMITKNSYQKVQADAYQKGINLCWSQQKLPHTKIYFD